MATLVSIFMIKHKELVREDEDRLREEAKQLFDGGKGKEKQPDLGGDERNVETISNKEDIEAGKWAR